MKFPSIIRRVTGRIPQGRRARVVAGLGVLLALPTGVVTWVAASVWMEDRFPADDPQRALLPVLQRVVTKPVVTFLSRHAERHVRARAGMLFMSTGMSLEETLARFLDERVALKDRRIHAYRLARVGSPECIAALLKVLATAPPEDKAFLAQLIGSTGNPAAKAWLLPLLEDDDETVVRAAIRGLGAIGGGDVTARVAALLEDAAQSQAIRIEAALGLGALGTPAANDALVRALGSEPTEDLTTGILGGLGRFHFSQVEHIFDRFLSHPDASPALKTAAVEALALSSEEAVPFLMAGAESHPDPDVRASAAWAISAHGDVPDCGAGLMRLAAREPEPDVRRRLYEAMLPQTSVAAGELLPKVRAEQDVAARVAGFNAVAAAVRRQPASDAAGKFDREIAPELVRLATEPNSLNLRMRAVFALRRAGTPGAQDALARILHNAPPQVAAAARHGLKATRP